MIPDLASVMRKRYRMERNLRFLSVLLVTLGVIVAGFGVVETVIGVLRGFTASGWIFAVVNSTPFLLAGAALGFGSSRVARWILPIPKAGCPRCGYRLVALVEPRCPECGLGLPRELMHGTDQG